MSRALPCALLLLTAGAGCVSLEPLREQQYSEVTVEQLEKAGSSDEEAVYAGLQGLLERRLVEADDVQIDLALEALLALRSQGRADSFKLVERCAREDRAEEVRYVALDVLIEIDPDGAPPVLRVIEQHDASALVRQHAGELTAR